MASECLKLTTKFYGKKNTYCPNIQKFYHNRKRAGKPPVALRPGDEVRMQPYPGNHKWSPRVVVKQHSAQCDPMLWTVETRSTAATVNTFAKALQLPTALATGYGVNHGLSEQVHLRRSHNLLLLMNYLTLHPEHLWVSLEPSQLDRSLPGWAELWSLLIDWICNWFIFD